MTEQIGYGFATGAFMAFAGLLSAIPFQVFKRFTK